MKLQWRTVSWNMGSVCLIYFSKNLCSSLFCSIGFIWSNFQSKSTYIPTAHLYLTFPCFLQVLCGQLFWNQWCSLCPSRPVSCCAAGSTCAPSTPTSSLSSSSELFSVPPYYHLKGPLLGIQAFKVHKTLLTLVTSQKNILVYSKKKKKSWWTGLCDIIDVNFLQNKVSCGLSLIFLSF